MIKVRTEEDFVNKAKQIHNNKFDYSKVKYINSKTKVEIVCHEHGSFWQTPNAHLAGKQCPACAKEKRIEILKNEAEKQRSSTASFIEKARRVHGDKYDYSKVNYINAKTKVEIICHEHGSFFMEPTNHLYGQDCPICKNKFCHDISWFIEKARLVHGDKYDYSESSYVDANTKLKIICPKHGSFLQTPDSHLSGKKCPLCAVEQLRDTKEDFVNKAKQVHGDKYDYSSIEYKGSKVPVCIICPKHGPFWQIPHGHLTGKGCPNCRRSKGEERIARFLENKNIKFVQDKACLEFLGELRPDFYLPDYNLVIEYDGKQHFMPIKIFGGEEHFEQTKKLDAYKNQLCEENNIRIIRIPYTKFNDIEKILNEYL